MNIVVTGATGFIGKNLCEALREAKCNFQMITRLTSSAERREILMSADIVYHFAGVNRPPQDSDFDDVNVGFTEVVCETLRESGRRAVIVLASSTQAENASVYGRSKRRAEDCVAGYANAAGATAYVYRLPNVFGKWSRPNYNSVVATFCADLAVEKLPEIREPDRILSLAYIDDVINEMLRLRDVSHAMGTHRVEVRPVYSIRVRDLYETIESLARGRAAGRVGEVGEGLERALYSTLVSFLPLSEWTRPLSVNVDSRGRFVEFIKTGRAGQVSYFTAAPGITRGGHYHHSKVERFLVVSGLAQFVCRDVQSGASLAFAIDAAEARFVEIPPGWWHSITNVGDAELVVLLWANETFDSNAPDTFAELAP